MPARERPLVAVVTDSASDLHEPPTDLSIVPLTVAFGTEAMLDGVDLSAEAFWDRVDASDEIPTTASPPPEAFARAYASAAATGAEAVVSVHVSAELSRTVASAQSAAADAPVPVHVVDTRSVSLGEGLVALAALDRARAGRDGHAVAAAAREAAVRLEVYAFLETVDFLQRGGRVGRARAAISDLLRIRPILTLDGGEPALAARARTRGRAIEEILTRAGADATVTGVLHARAPEAEAVARRLGAATGTTPIVSLVGSVTGSHLGPGCLGVALLRPPGH